MMNYYNVLETPVSKITHRLSYKAVTASFKMLGRRRFFDNFDFIDDIFDEVGIEKTNSSGRQVRDLVYEQDAHNFADIGLLMHGSDSQIRKHLTDKVVLHNLDVINNLKGMPYLIVGAHFASFYICALAEKFLENTTIIRRFHSDGRDTLIDRLKTITDKKIDVLGVTDKNIAIEIVRRIKRNEPVAAMIDYFYEDTSLFLLPFFGKPSATPAGIPIIAARMSIPLVMINVFRRGSHFHIKIEEPMYPDTNEDRMASAFELATKMNANLEKIIRDNPEQWVFWPSVAKRWQYAQNAIDNEAS